MQSFKTILLFIAIAYGVVACKSGNKKANDATSEKSGDKKETKATEITDETFFGFMLGGMYPAAGWGGVTTIMPQIMQSVTADVDTKDYLDQLQAGYKEVLTYPFVEEQSSGTKATLESMWGITDAGSLNKRLNELIDEKHGKAWDLARYVNVINLAECAHIITKSEGNELVKKIVPVAKKNYDDWDTYMKDFNTGHKNWAATNDEPDPGFEKASLELLTTKNSIYKYLKL
jgi:hypothetical protein